LERVQSPPPANGLELWNDRGRLFPNLDFCDSVEGQIRSLGGNEPRFKAVSRGLSDLQKYCDSWNTGSFDINQVPHASGESLSTLNSLFRLPGSEAHPRGLCRWTPENIRPINGWSKLAVGRLPKLQQLTLEWPRSPHRPR
jgi:hypothetical protein